MVEGLDGDSPKEEGEGTKLEDNEAPDELDGCPPVGAGVRFDISNEPGRA